MPKEPAGCIRDGRGRLVGRAQLPWHADSLRREFAWLLVGGRRAAGRYRRVGNAIVRVASRVQLGTVIMPIERDAAAESRHHRSIHHRARASIIREPSDRALVLELQLVDELHGGHIDGEQTIQIHDANAIRLAARGEPRRLQLSALVGKKGHPRRGGIECIVEVAPDGGRLLRVGEVVRRARCGTAHVAFDARRTSEKSRILEPGRCTGTGFSWSNGTLPVPEKRRPTALFAHLPKCIIRCLECYRVTPASPPPFIVSVVNCSYFRHCSS